MPRRVKARIDPDRHLVEQAERDQGQRDEAVTVARPDGGGQELRRRLEQKK
jgi:hypothetical protein